jgi:hypothetical protein
MNFLNTIAHAAAAAVGSLTSPEEKQRQYIDHEQVGVAQEVADVNTIDTLLQTTRRHLSEAQATLATATANYQDIHQFKPALEEAALAAVDEAQQAVDKITAQIAPLVQQSERAHSALKTATDQVDARKHELTDTTATDALAHAIEINNASQKNLGALKTESGFDAAAEQAKVRLDQATAAAAQNTDPLAEATADIAKERRLAALRAKLQGTASTATPAAAS